jgi:ribosome-binding protein aMBF1 (putative translation factor)
VSTDTWRGWKAPRPYVPPKERNDGLVLNRGDFGTLLKSLREKRGVSQSKLAEKAEFDHRHVSRLEAGTSPAACA